MTDSNGGNNSPPHLLPPKHRLSKNILKKDNSSKAQSAGYCWSDWELPMSFQVTLQAGTSA